MSERAFERQYFDLARQQFDRNNAKDKKKDKLKHKIREAGEIIEGLLDERKEMISYIARLESIAKHYGSPDQCKPSKWVNTSQK